MKEFKLEDEETKTNPAFINDFIEICWVDPWAADPAKPIVRGIPAKRKKKILKDFADKSKTITRKGMSFIDDLNNQPIKDISSF